MAKLHRALRKVESAALVALLRRKSPGIHPSTKFIGRPFIQILGDGAGISIGAGSSVVSVSARTALALQHPANIRVIKPGAHIVIGSGVGISGGTFVAARRIQIGDGCLIGANVTICDTDFHPIASLTRSSQPLPEPQPGDEVDIGKNVFIGTGAVILKGTTIGDNSVVGAGAIVKGQFPPGVTIAGNPARVIKPIEFTDVNAQ